MAKKDPTMMQRRSFLSIGSAVAGACLLDMSGFVKSAVAQGIVINPPANGSPCIIPAVSEFAALRTRWQGPSKKIYDNFSGAGGEAYAVRAIMNNSTADATSAKNWAMGQLRGGSSGALNSTSEGANTYNFSTMRWTHRALLVLDIADGFGVVSSSEKSEALGIMEPICNTMLSQRLIDVMAKDYQVAHNFADEPIAWMGMTALMWYAHPNANKWLDWALTHFTRQMEVGIPDKGTEGGPWNEVSQYGTAVLRSIVPLAYGLRRRTNFDWFANDGFKNLINGQISALTSPNRIYGDKFRTQANWPGAGPNKYCLYTPNEGLRLQVGLGDSWWSHFWFSTIAMCAPAYAQLDPEFSKRIMWAWKATGGSFQPESTTLSAPLILIDPSLPSSDQTTTLKSYSWPVMGYTQMRANVGKSNERYALLKCGRNKTEHWASHYHSDLNSFSIMWDGVPLSLDPCRNEYSSSMHIPWNQHTRSHNTVMFGGKEQAKETTEGTVTGIDGFTRKFYTKPEADYVLGDASAASHVERFFRHFLFVKPDYFLIWDELISTDYAEFLLHCHSDSMNTLENGIEFVTPWGINLHALFLTPAVPLTVVTAESGFDNPGVFGNGTWEIPNQRWARVRAPAGKGFLTILHPRANAENRITAQKIGTIDQVVEVKMADGQTDYIMLFPESRTYSDSARKITMKGSIGIVRKGPRSNSLVLLEGEQLTDGSQEVTIGKSDYDIRLPVPMRISVNKNQLTLQFRISRPSAVSISVLTLNGAIESHIVNTTIPGGEHTLSYQVNGAAGARILRITFDKRTLHYRCTF